MKALECEHVYKVFGKDSEKIARQLHSGTTVNIPEGTTVAVNDVSFDVNQGEIFVVMGLSGSGKSTLLRTLNALGPASAGSIKVMGQDITTMSPAQIREHRKKYMSMVFQHFALLPHRTVIENAAYPLEIQGVAKEEREKQALKQLHIAGLKGWENHFPGELSGGMQQRVGLARALVASGDILLMDEAFSALDPLIRRDMQELLLEIQAEQQRTIIFITHDLNEAMYLGNRIAVMRHGKVEQVGTAEEILTNPANDYVRRFVEDVDRSRVITASSIMIRPLTRIYATDGPRVVLRKLEEVGQEGGWVISGGNRILNGYVYAEEIIAAMKKHPTMATIETLIHPSHPGISPETPVSDVVAPSADQPIPVPVVSTNGRLLGVIPRVRLLQALSWEDSAQEIALPDSPAVDTGALAVAPEPDEYEDSPTNGEGTK